jgi:hypothetical protein
MLQVYVINVLTVLNVCCKCVYLDVAYVAVSILICCKCFIYFGHMLKQMLYVASVSSADAVRGRRQRWSPRAEQSPRARGKPSGCDNRCEAQSCIHRRGSRRGARSCIHARLLSLSSLLIRARCGLSAAVSRANSSMRAARVCGHTWLVAAKLLMAASTMISPYKRARSNRDQAQRLGEGARKDTARESRTRGEQHAWGIRTHCWRRTFGP